MNKRKWHCVICYNDGSYVSNYLTTLGVIEFIWNLEILECRMYDRENGKREIVIHSVDSKITIKEV